MEDNFYTFEIFGRVVRRAIDDYKDLKDKKRKGDEEQIFNSAKMYLFSSDGLEGVFERIPRLSKILSLEAIRKEALKESNKKIGGEE